MRKKNKIKTKEQWLNFCKNKNFPFNVPKAVSSFYKKKGDWISWGDFFGTNYEVKKNYVDYNIFKKELLKRKVNSQTEFYEFTKDKKFPKNFPKAPQNYYSRRNVWKGWRNLFEKRPSYERNNKNELIHYLSYDEAKLIVHKMNISSSSEWQKLLKLNKIPDKIPGYPSTAYLKEFKGWGDFLGSGRIADRDKHKFFPSYKEASTYAIKHKIKSEFEWHKLYQNKKPDDFIIATGKQYTVKSFINKTCQKLNLKIKWIGKGENEKAINLKNNNIIIKIDQKYFRPLEVKSLLGNYSKSKKLLKWKPKCNIDDLISDMINNEMNNLSKK